MVAPIKVLKNVITVVILIGVDTARRVAVECTDDRSQHLLGSSRKCGQTTGSANLSRHRSHKVGPFQAPSRHIDLRQLLIEFTRG